MDPLYLYAIKINVAVIIFYIFYRIFFYKDTFFEIKRFCLLAILLLSLTCPVINLSDWLGERGGNIANYIQSFQEITISGITVTQTTPDKINIEQILWSVYGAGAVYLLTRMLIQLLSIFRLVFSGKRLVCLNTNVISLGENTTPFSFFKYIFVHPDDHTLKEIQEIITHEKTHVDQWHSLDMVISELMCILLWFNPVVWLFKHEICQNLEFLADRHVVKSGYNRRNYQYHLLRLSHQPAAAQLINNFNVSQLKKRITMMNKKKTSNVGLIKYALLLPVTVLLILSGNVKAITNVTRQEATAQDTTIVYHLKAVKNETDNTQKVKLSIVEDLPEFDGDINAYISRNVEYPAEAKEKGIQGIVNVSFTVEKDGKIANAKIAKSVDPLLDKEALRVITGMPDWQPGKLKGKVISVKYTIPVEFKLSGDPRQKEAKSSDPSENIVVIGYGETTPDVRAYSIKGEKNTPLYIIDGKEQSKDIDLKSIDPKNIQSISVLKDSTAVIQYGGKGKNGVIIITTKEL